MDCSLPGSFCPWDYPGKNIGVVCNFLLQGIFQPRDRITSPVTPAIAGRFFITESPGKPLPPCGRPAKSHYRILNGTEAAHAPGNCTLSPLDSASRVTRKEDEEGVMSLPYGSCGPTSKRPCVRTSWWHNCHWGAHKHLHEGAQSRPHHLACFFWTLCPKEVCPLKGGFILIENLLRCCNYKVTSWFGVHISHLPKPSVNGMRFHPKHCVKHWFLDITAAYSMRKEKHGHLSRLHVRDGRLDCELWTFSP